MNNIENLSLVDLKFLLKQINKYKNFKKQLWNRWIELFNQKLTWRNIFTTDYFNNEELSSNIALSIYKKIFNLDVKKEDIKFIKNENIKWWVKVFMNDSMVDVSFSKIEKLIK